MNTVYVVGTCDTKAAELDYVRRCIARSGLPAVLVDVGTRGKPRDGVLPDVGADIVAAYHPDGASAVFGNAGDSRSDGAHDADTVTVRGTAIAAMARALTIFVSTRPDLGGIIGIGGSGNTALVTEAMRMLPIGLPKLMVSTVASGNVGAYMGTSDIAMMYSVVDIAGLNRISRIVLGNAAHAIAAMTARRGELDEPAPGVTLEHRPSIGITMFGVTTSCVDQLRDRLQADYECLVFHATGTGGQALEKLIDSGMIDGAFDITTTEVADLLAGGVFPCLDDRFGAIARTRVPYVGSCGALDMVNFGAKESVPERYRARTLYFHNSQITLMRTDAQENRRAGEWIAARLNRCDGPVRFLIPEKGVSAIDAEGMPFHNPVADEALFSALEANLEQTAQRQLIRLPLHINDARFADAAVATYREIARSPVT
jgi:uncharacterized protein (UPF0261 family)